MSYETAESSDSRHVISLPCLAFMHNIWAETLLALWLILPL